MKVTTREKELTTSEKQKIYNTVEIEVGRSNLIKVTWQGVEVGQLIMRVGRLDFNPKGGFDADLDITNITPLNDNWE